MALFFYDLFIPVYLVIPTIGVYLPARIPVVENPPDQICFCWAVMEIHVGYFLLVSNDQFIFVVPI